MHCLSALASIVDLMGPLDPPAMARIALAAILGGAVGWERERHGREAGLRTHLLLCTGCALMMLVSLYIPASFAEHSAQSVVRADPTRVASQVVTGIGFLGAGAILVLGRRIRGLTTAASIWVTAAIGLAVGAGYVAPAVFTWLVAMFALLVLGRLENRVTRKDRYISLRLEFSSPGARFEEARAILDAHALSVLGITLERQSDAAEYTAALRHSVAVDYEQVTDVLMERLGSRGLVKVKWQ
jgi:putative Mg2+ transporter-C (MgtC) family protein